MNQFLFLCLLPKSRFLPARLSILFQFLKQKQFIQKYFNADKVLIRHLFNDLYNFVSG